MMESSRVRSQNFQPARPISQGNWLSGAVSTSTALKPGRRSETG